MKRTFLLLLIIAVAAVSGAAQKQGKGPVMITEQRPGIAPMAPMAQAGTIVMPSMPADDQLKIRNLQFEQDKKLLEMQRLQLRLLELQAQVTADTTVINDAVRAGAKTAGVDLDKVLFDLDSMKFIPRPAAVVNQSTKPLEVKH